MNRDQKRFTISVTPELAAELTAVKQSSYPGVPRDAMFRDLIIRGLAAWEKQSGKNSQWAAARTRHPMETAEQFWAFLTGSVQSGAGFSPYVIRS